jgi:hypothetical protein
MCALTHAPDSAPARLAAAKSREAADANAAVARATADLAVKRAAADNALSDAEVAKSAIHRAESNQDAAKKRLSNANKDLRAVERNAMTPEEQGSNENLMQLSEERQAQIRGTPEWIGQQKRFEDAWSEQRTAFNDKLEAENVSRSALQRAENAVADVERATKAVGVAPACPQRQFQVRLPGRRTGFSA